MQPTELMLKLLADIAGQDIAKMSDDQQENFRAQSFEQFKTATGDVASLFFGPKASSDGWVWAASRPEFSNDWLGRLRFVPTSQIEANIGEHEKVQMAAALFPPLSFDIDLFGDFHYHPDGRGLQSVPHYLLALDAMGDPGLKVLETMLEASAPMWRDLAKQGVRLTVLCTEGAIEDIEAPVDVGAAFKKAAAAARRKAKREHGDEEMAETVRLWAAVQGDISDETFEMLLGLCGATMRSAAKPLSGL